jgi:DNA-binding transcriptional MerR regulator
MCNSRRQAGQSALRPDGAREGLSCRREQPIGSAHGADPGGSIKTFTISALERTTGVPRSTIHFYIGEELLPRPAKTAASRSLYTEAHVELLQRITSLKQSGLSLAEIKEELQDDPALSKGSGIDLAAHEYERIHGQIVTTATEEFVANGYENTHLATIVKRIGITPHVFYTHFASKHQLLAECFGLMVDSTLRSVEAKLETTSDLAERLLARLAFDTALHTLQSEAVSLIRTETSAPPNDASEVLIEMYARLAEQVAADIGAMRAPGRPAGGVPVELLAYSMLGAYDNTQLRASWDGTYDRADLFRAHLWLFFAMRAALDGRIDVDSEVAAYEERIRQAAGGEG